MTNIGIVQSLQAKDGLREDGKDLLRWEVSSLLDMFGDFLVEISAVSVLHHKAEALRACVDEGFFVLDDVGVVHTGKQPDLVQGVLFVFLGEAKHLDLFEGV